MLCLTGSPPLTVLSVIKYLTPASTSNKTSSRTSSMTARSPLAPVPSSRAILGGESGNLLRPRGIEASNLERSDRSRLDIDHADLVIVGVGHIEAVSSHAQTAGLIEAGRIVLAAGLAVAGERLDCEGIGVADLDLVVVGIGDEKLAAAVG